ncbi:MAG: hypothetical protein J5I62_01895 [Flavobacteriales bacterium]|nr:hypothetical protein [Flavobacteriales bacterium]MEB2340868.1 hypothetical protein [Flavobacteriia bacterium]
MKVAILETVHFQYGLTQAEVFQDAEKVFFVTEELHRRMHDYDASLCEGEFIIIRDLAQDAQAIINKCNGSNVNLLLINPIFKEFEDLYRIVRQTACPKVITIHNLNFWLKSFFRTPKYYRERKLKQAIVQACEYIAVEDFLYHYIRTRDPKLFNRYKFIYIPFTLFHPRTTSRYVKDDPTRFKVVIPGQINPARRRYEEVIEVIHHFARSKAPITFSLPGKPMGDYGKWVAAELDKANREHPGITYVFPAEGTVTTEMFLREMETSDLVLSSSSVIFRDLGTKEIYGKTKAPGAIYDMMSFQLPGLLPAHLGIPENLAGSAFTYATADELRQLLQTAMDRPEIYAGWKKRAEENAFNYTAEAVRKHLPFFNPGLETT